MIESIRIVESSYDGLDIFELIETSQFALRDKNYPLVKDLLNKAWEKIQYEVMVSRDETKNIQDQVSVQNLLGRCYMEEAIETKNIADAYELFKFAETYFTQVLSLIKKSASNQEHVHANYWLGRNYMEQAIKVIDIAHKESLFVEAMNYYEKSFTHADIEVDASGYNNCLHWLGRCYLERAIITKDDERAKELFKLSVQYYQKRLALVRRASAKEELDEINALGWMGDCYLQYALRYKKHEKQYKALLEMSCNQYINIIRLVSSINSQSYKELIHKSARSSLRKIHFLKCNPQYFLEKNKFISKNLKLDSKKSQLNGYISSILTVLNVSPIELDKIPLAHYTSPFVCESLFGLSDKKNINEGGSKMRMGSSTYMNDPLEGKSLLELLNQQDLELETKTDFEAFNAFFTCFSARINDLNQFRLYGKEDGVEASGCCLVFNKNGKWLEEPNMISSYRFGESENSELETKLNASLANETDKQVKDLPLYQVAYIAYEDEYISGNKCDFWISLANGKRFGIQLKNFGDNPEWHAMRLNKLQEALRALIEYFSEKTASAEDRKALEYIRYLFKDFAFRDEEEFRLLKIAEVGSKDIEYCPITDSVFVSYADICEMVDEVILGTNFEKTNRRRKAEVFRHFMKSRWPSVNVTHSSLPINANLPRSQS